MMSQRATTMGEFRALQGKMFEESDFEHLPGLVLRPNDIVISPFGKCGTTWLQQIVHCLRTSGDMDFDDISRVIPWIETSPSLGLDLNAEQKANPRAFKSHLEYEKLPSGARYINSVRNPNDAALSMFKFMEGWFIEPGTVTLDDFIEGFVSEGRFWQHLISWWKQRNSDHVLYLAYEQMTIDLEGSICRIAEFIDIPLSEDLLELTMEHASMAFMQSHGDRFDDKLMRALSEKKCGLPTGGESAKVRKGVVGDSKNYLSDKSRAALDNKWHKEVTETLGFKDYDALISAL
ncbi:MAG: hypothetical protein ACI9CE_001994 [Flavobacterium sp.]|jgi:hypothetical protein